MPVMRVEVVLTGGGTDHGLHLDTGVTHPADTVINSGSRPKLCCDDVIMFNQPTPAAVDRNDETSSSKWCEYVVFAS